MKTAALLREIIATYERHGWKLQRVLLTDAGRRQIEGGDEAISSAAIVESDIDALWFARPSHARREAWELRLISEQPYALFEAFESDETEAEREDARREMENRMRAFTGGATS